MLRLWNTATRSLETFKPIKGKTVGLYTCGPTVYNPATIGNLRTYVSEDVIERTLMLFGYKVKHVMNITDVGHLVGDGDAGEDKVEREAARQGKTAWDIAKQYEKMFVTDLERLNVLVPKGKNRPHATDYIQEQIDLIQRLESEGYTYRTSDGIYFDTIKFKDYGKLSRQKISEKEAGARVEMNLEKKNQADFALWKFSYPGGRSFDPVQDDAAARRHMEWASPWGLGFPGWHIECSAMSRKLLGQPFDIHAGGVDHIPVHHENEIAQSEAAYGKPLANYWLHAEFLLIDGGRMGKSEGNAYLLDDVIAKGFDPLAFRYFCLGAHYRTKLNFTWEALEGADSALRSLRAQARQLPRKRGKPQGDWVERFKQVLAEDLNTSKALALIWDLLKSDASDEEKAKTLFIFDKTLALGLADVIGKPVKAPKAIKLLAEERLLARQNKDWKRSDELRDLMKSKGWIVEDTKDSYELQPE